jgi:hypothetical protein
MPAHAIFNGDPKAYVDEALFLDVSKEGFEAISKIAQEHLIENIKDQEIEDLKLEIPLVARFAVKDIKVAIKTEKIRVMPIDGGLDVALDIRDLTVTIGEARLSNWWLPGLKTSCYNTKISFGNGWILPLRARFGLKYRNGKIQFRDQGLNFNLNPKQYVTKGPTSCRGTFGVKDHFTQFIVQKVISQARNSINIGLKMGVKLLSTKLGDLLLGQLERFRLPITVPNLLIIPETKIRIGLRINYLKISSQKMRVVLGVAIEKSSDKINDGGELPELLKYATVGINPRFLNRLVRALIPREGSLPIEITPDFHEMLDDILKASEFVNFIPDLDQIELDTDRIRLFFRILSAPKVGFSKDNGALDAQMKNLQIKMMVKTGGEWIDYFFFTVNARLKLKGEIIGEKFTIFPKLSFVNVDGHFAKSYKPTVREFSLEELEESLRVIVEIFTESEDGIEMDAPTIVLGRWMIKLENLKIRPPFVFLDIWGRNLY